MPNKIPSNNQWQDLADRIKAKVNLADLFNLVYPVGTYYTTSDLRFNPSESFGGVWEVSSDIMQYGGEAWDDVGETWDLVGTVWQMDEVRINRWHRIN